MDKIFDPINDLLKPTPSFMAPGVPAPDVAATGGMSIQDPIESLIPKPPRATPASSISLGAIKDPIDDFLSSNTRSMGLGDMLFPSRPPPPPRFFLARLPPWG